MYEELILNLRSKAAKLPEKFSKNAESIDLMLKAADAIEELCGLCASQSKDCSEAVAKYLELWAKQPRWIPVTERLPENEVPVHVVYLSVNDGKQYSDLIACVFEGMWCYWDGEPCSYDECKCEITHWMPLQSPPKEEK